MSARQTLRGIYDAALRASDPRGAVARALVVESGALRVGEEVASAAELERVWIVGAGKAVCGMALGAVETLGGWIAGGTAVTVDGAARPVPGVEVWEAGHPLPDVRSLAAASEALRVARAARSGELVLCLLSGGASALWASPPSGVTLGDLRTLTAALLRSGAPIGEVNAVRKHLSRIAGGGLARAAAPARWVTLAISDVVDAGVEAIGSGPTVADPTTFADALDVLRERGVEAPTAVLAHLRKGAAGAVPETAKPGAAALARGSLHVVASVRGALEAAAAEAVARGYAPRIVDSALRGEAREVGARIARLARESAGEGRRALLFGGETTVTVRGAGTGGRSQEVALGAAEELAGVEGIALLAAGTDGVDGPTSAAGAFADGGTVERGRRAGVDATDALCRNDAHPFLRAAGDLLVTGPTGTNVNDLVVVLVEG